VINVADVVAVLPQQFKIGHCVIKGTSLHFNLGALHQGLFKY
jgi:hypothetical protein